MLEVLLESVQCIFGEGALLYILVWMYFWKSWTRNPNTHIVVEMIYVKILNMTWVRSSAAPLMLKCPFDLDFDRADFGFLI